MAIRYVSLTCDKCGATLTTTNDRTILYCEHCGNKIYVNDTSTKTININKKVESHEIKEDRAKIEEAKTERLIGIFMLIFLFILVFSVPNCWLFS